MPKCSVCGEWFVGSGDVCGWCNLRKNVVDNVKRVSGKHPASIYVNSRKKSRRSRR